jgi:drug/metabolite transporter (DMT)-like permease
VTAPDDKRALGLVAATSAVLVWGSSSVLVKDVAGVSGLVVGFHRMWIGAVLTSIAFLATGKRFSWRLLRLSFFGGVAFALDIVLFFSALKGTSVANATIIGAMQPVLVLAVAGRMFGERPHLRGAFWAAVAIAGAVIVIVGGSSGGEESLRGDLLAVGALFAWTWYFIASKQARRELGSLDYLTGLSIVAVVVVTPIVLVSGESIAVPELSGWIDIVIVAVVNGALGHFLMNWAHAHVPIVVTSLLTLGIPVFATATAAIFLDEGVTAVQVGGMVVVLGALAVVVLHTSRSAEEDLEPHGVAP